MVETAKIDSTLMAKTGVKFSEGSVTKIEKTIIVPIGQQGSANQQTVDGADITLSNGVTFTIPLGQKSGAKVSVIGSNTYLEKLSDVDELYDSFRANTDHINLIGCKNVLVAVNHFDETERDADFVTISDHADGTKSANISVSTDKDDIVDVLPVGQRTEGEAWTQYKTNDELYFNNNFDKKTQTRICNDGTKELWDDDTKTLMETYKDGQKAYYKEGKLYSEGSHELLKITLEEYNAIQNHQQYVEKKDIKAEAATTKAEDHKKEAPNGTGEYRCAEVADPIRRNVYYDPTGKEISAFEFMMKTQG